MAHMSQISSSSIGKRLHDLRQEHGFSQQQIADALGIPRQSVSLVEKGERDLTALELAAFTDLLQISYDDVLSPPTIDPKEEVAEETVVFDPKKLRNLLLLLLQKVGGKPNVGETVLYKLLYFCDFDHFERTGKSITGLTYRRLQFGPVPQRNQFDSVVETMERHGELEKMAREYHGKMQVRYIAHVDAHPEVFDEPELKTIHHVLLRMSDMSATEIAEFVHGDVPWAATKQNAAIDYDLASMRTEPYAVVTDEEVLSAFEQAAADDSEALLEPTTKEEYDYYMSLPDLPDDPKKSTLR